MVGMVLVVIARFGLMPALARRDRDLELDAILKQRILPTRFFFCGYEHEQSSGFEDRTHHKCGGPESEKRCFALRSVSILHLTRNHQLSLICRL